MGWEGVGSGMGSGMGSGTTCSASSALASRCSLIWTRTPSNAIASLLPSAAAAIPSCVSSCPRRTKPAAIPLNSDESGSPTLPMSASPADFADFVDVADVADAALIPSGEPAGAAAAPPPPDGSCRGARRDPSTLSSMED